MSMYEKIKSMSFDDMAEFLAATVIGSCFAVFGLADLATPDGVKSHPQYELALEKAKEMLAEEVSKT